MMAAFSIPGFSPAVVMAALMPRLIPAAATTVAFWIRASLPVAVTAAS
jgi:hypothetical protein